MMFKYCFAFCALTASYSRAVARPGSYIQSMRLSEPLKARAFLNTTVTLSVSTTNLLTSEAHPIPSTSTEITDSSTFSTTSITPTSLSSSKSLLFNLGIADTLLTSSTVSTTVTSSTIASISSTHSDPTSITSTFLSSSTSSTTSISSELLSTATSASISRTSDSSTSPSRTSTINTPSSGSSATSTSLSMTSYISTSSSQSSSSGTSLSGSSTSSVVVSYTISSTISASSTNTTSISSSSITSLNTCASTVSLGKSSCIDYLCGAQTYYIWANTTVTEITTVYGNLTTLPIISSSSQLPPSPCLPTQTFPPNAGISASAEATRELTSEPTTITLISTSKTTTTVTQAPPPPNFVQSVVLKATVTPQPSNPETQTSQIPPHPVELASKSVSDALLPQTQPFPPPQAPPQSALGSQPAQQPQPPPITNPPTNANPPVAAITVPPIIIGPDEVLVGGATFTIDSGFTAITVDGQVFTINPSQVIAPQTTIERTTPVFSAPGGILPGSGPTTILVEGVPVTLSSSVAVVDGSTFAIGPGASEQTITVAGQVISMGPEGVAAVVASATPAPGLGNARVTTIGSGTLEAIVDGTTFAFSPDLVLQTAIINGQTISIGPGGIAFGNAAGIPTSDLGSAPQAFPTSVITIGHVTLTQAGSAVVIGTQTFTIDPKASSAIIVVNGETVSIGPGGIGIGTATVTIPNSSPTKIITTNGVTITEIGSLAIVGEKTYTVGAAGLDLASLTLSAPTTLGTSVVLPGDIILPGPASTLVVIGGTTFTIGPNASPTTDIYKGQTISIGPGGVGFVGSSTTIPYSVAPNPTETRVITSQGITYTVIGSTIAIVGGSTFQIGNSAPPVTERLGDKTISIGPGGVAFIRSVTATGTGTSLSKDTAAAVISAPTASKTSGSGSNYLYNCHLLALCIFLGVWVII